MQFARQRSDKRPSRCRRHAGRFILLIGLLAMTPLLTGCIRDDSNENGVTTMQVELGDWFVRPDEASVQADEVTFDASNEGAVAHELVIVRTGLHSDALPMSGNRADVEAAGDVVGRISTVPPGETRSGTFTLTPDRYVLLCNIDGHYQAGMHTNFEVTPPE